MMNSNEKIYFLLNRIDDMRVIVPSGQPLIIDPTNNLNRNYIEVELTQLFTKLEKDEKILQVLNVPSRINVALNKYGLYDRTDGYAEDGCWHIKLLPAFDNYFLKIQQEPEYQEFTGKKPVVSPTKTDGNVLMIYEEKLDRIVKALMEAKKATRKGKTTTLYLNGTNGLNLLDREEIRNILLQLQDENILKVNPKTNRLLPLSQQPVNPSYFLLDILDGFDDWYENYLLKRKSKLENLNWFNLVKILDVCVSINEQLQIVQSGDLTIPSLPYPNLGRFPELFPFDTVGTRDNYQEYRWEGSQFLLKQGILRNVYLRNDDLLAYGKIEMGVNLVKFEDFHHSIWAEYKRRKESADKKEEKPQTENPIIDPKKMAEKVAYNAQKGELNIETKKVKFKKDSFRAKILELLLKDDKNRKKEWSWDEVIEGIENTKGKEATKESKKKFYPACDGLSKHIALKIGVNDLLIFNKSTVQINSKYL